MNIASNRTKPNQNEKPKKKRVGGFNSGGGVGGVLRLGTKRKPSAVLQLEIYTLVEGRICFCVDLSHSFVRFSTIVVRVK